MRFLVHCAKIVVRLCIVYVIRLIESKWLKRKIKCVNTKKNSKMDVSRVEINKLEESLMSEQCESARK